MASIQNKGPSPSSQVVNFSDLNEEEQSKYVEFLVMNNFQFDADTKSKDSSYLATIKINPTQSKAMQGLSQESSKVIEQKKIVSQPPTLDSLASTAVSTGSNIQIRTPKSPNAPNNRYSRSPLPNRSQQSSISSQTPASPNVLSNITNKQMSNHLAVRSSQQGIKPTSKKPQKASGTVTPPTQQAPTAQEIDVKKSQIIEKLALKLKEADDLAKEEEEEAEKLKLSKNIQKQPEEKVVTPQNNNNRSRKISQDIIDKNKMYLQQLQEQVKNKANASKQQQQARKSVSPVAQRKPVVGNTLDQSSQIAAKSRLLSCSREKTRPVHQVQQPSTFQQIMDKQSQLINSVCSQATGKGQGSRNKSNGEQNESKKEKENLNCFEFNSFGNPNSTCISTNPPPIQQSQADDFKLYNISSKRTRGISQSGPQQVQQQQQQQQQQKYARSGSSASNVSSTSSSFTNKQPSIDKKELNRGGGLSALRKQCGDSSMMLRPTRLPLGQILKWIDELYEAKFFENTMLMKTSNMNSRGEVAKKLWGTGSGEVAFCEFVCSYFRDKFGSAKAVCEQHLLNLIASVEYFQQTSDRYSESQIIAINTFAAFVQNEFNQDELIFYLFVREMMQKCCNVIDFDSNKRYQETQSIAMTLNQCSEVLSHVYGQKEAKIIDRFMHRLQLKIAETEETKIHANLFLSMALADYIEGKSNKIYESSEVSKQSNRGIPPKLVNSSEDRHEYTFEQSSSQSSFNDSVPIESSNRSRSFGEDSEIDARIWDKMCQKISDFIHLVIADNYEEENNAASDRSTKFTSIERIVSSKINKMISALVCKDIPRWLELLCISRASSSQLANFETLTNILEGIYANPSDNISEISIFCKTLLQTKELTKAIGKLLVCILMPDSAA